ncbi:hypothetical protein [Polynucleobacter antarcticus]|uniref:Uncharacterized protein n=1 Tax=Polynucleobacter antarcticus TaxID=1743162 RepID=A0A6M9Q4A1_9BURK|nr:hypothetical protein [Polynucleobacter antarcticus]QKM63323.1 hypothetical protein DCO16_09905 [Polynucleobacter antarcticus]
MRRLCLLICFCLFASLIHAATMPIAGQNQSSSHEMVMADSSTHSHEAPAEQAKAKTTIDCHSNVYQCCLGFIITHQISSDSITSLREKSETPVPSLMVEGFSSSIYKPPKFQS